MSSDNKMYVIKATVFGEKGRVLTQPMSKESADAFANRLKDDMADIDDEFKSYTDIKVAAYKPESLYLNKDGVNPYSTIMDALDAKI